MAVGWRTLSRDRRLKGVLTKILHTSESYIPQPVQPYHIRCTAGYYGGAIYLGDLVNYVHIQDVNITGCSSGAKGGGIAITSMADALLENVRIYNGASEEGGALAIFSVYSYSSGTAEVVVDSCLLLGNNATQSGGALFASQGVVTVQASTFMNNTAMSMTGGHIAIESDASLVLSNSALSGGTAPSGGGLSVAGNATILSALLTQNLATAGGGGALYVTGSAVVNHSHFWGNRFVGTDAEELVSLGAHQPLCEYRGLTRTVHPPPCQICDTLEMIAAWGTGWYGSILTIWDSSDTLVFSSAGPEDYFLSASFCYIPGETYSFEVSQIQGWYFNYYSWVAPSIINWEFGDGLVADNGDETVTTFVGPAAPLDVSCVSLWKHSLLPEPFTCVLLSK